MDLDQISPHLYLGSCPRTAADIDRLKRDFGITAVLNLQTNADNLRLEVPWDVMESHYRDCGIEVQRCPVEDDNQEDLRQQLPACVRALDRLLRAGHVVYVHCTAGMTRSATVVMAYLLWIERISVDEAITQVVGRRYCDPSLLAIELAADDYHPANTASAIVPGS